MRGVQDASPLHLYERDLGRDGAGKHGQVRGRGGANRLEEWRFLRVTQPSDCSMREGFFADDLRMNVRMLEEMRASGGAGRTRVEVEVSGGKVHKRSDGRREGKEGGKLRRVRSRSYGETESVKEGSRREELQRCGAEKER